MATSQEIKGFIARWLQLGKRIEHIDGTRYFKPERILAYQGYSQEFETWWQEFESDAGQWVLSGSERPLSALFKTSWEITSCARCDMPIPIQVSGVNDVTCTCDDLGSWPNLELPHPHLPEDANNRLEKIRHRLKR